jgi:hypothetical protein
MGHDSRAPDAVGYGARVPAVVPHGGRNLTPPSRSADRWRHPYCRAPRRKELLPPWGLAVDVYFLKFLVDPLFSKIKEKYKKIPSSQNKQI